MNLFRTVCFSAFLFLPPQAHADEVWYNEDLQRVTENNNCQVYSYRSGKEYLHFILTPEYYVTWCQRMPIRKLGPLICPGLSGPVESNEKEGTGRIIACRREYVDVPQEPPSYDLIVLTSREGHEWHACPKFINLDVYGTHSLWIEKNTKPYGETFSLSQFWIAESVFKETEIVASDAPADGHALLYGDFGAGQILYCYQNQWVMSGYH